MRLIASKFILISFLILLNVFNASAQEDYYWVGGTGNWSDFATHWATASGGTTFHTQSPTILDNVFFDANSFTADLQTVTVDVVVDINNLDFSGISNSATLTLSNDLNINGETASFSSLLTISGFRNIFLKGANESNLTPNGVNYNRGITIDATGKWTINGVFKLSGSNTFRIENGLVDLTDSLITRYITINGGELDAVGNPIIAKLENGNGQFRINANGALNIRNATIETSNFEFYGEEIVTAGSKIILFNPSNGNNIFFGGGNTYNFLSINGSATISNHSNSFDSLVLLEGSNVIFPANQTQTVNQFVSEGNPSLFNSISSSTLGSPSFISQANNNATVSWTRITDIHAIGGASFVAQNSSDLGNNSGWSFPAATGEDFYWVGDGGNWSDFTNHWSSSSGGVPDKTRVPNLFDNVIFDANSFTIQFQTVIMDVIGNVNNLDWSANNDTTTFRLSNNLELYGNNIVLSPILDFGSGFGGLYFEGINGTFIPNGAAINKNIFFQSPGEWLIDGKLNMNASVTLRINDGTVTLNDSLKTRFVYINGAYLNTNGQYVLARLEGNTGAFQIYSGGRADISNSTIETTSFENFGTGVVTDNSEIIINNNGTNGTNYFYGRGEDYNKVSLSGNVIISSQSNTFDSLILKPNSTIRFPSNNTQKFNYLEAVGNASSIITMNTSSTALAVLEQSTGTINADWLSINNIAAVGGATFNATNSVISLSSTGWNITPPTSQDFYWVGNGGDWKDFANHWSTISGGAPDHTREPNFFDNVFFDANSFTSTEQVITIPSGENIMINNMDWTGVTESVDLTLADELEIHGNQVNLAPELLISGTAAMLFFGDQPGVFNVNGATYATDITFQTDNEWLINGVVRQSADVFRINAGKVVLTDSLITNFIYLADGELDASDQYINAFGNTGYLRTFGNSKINLTRATVLTQDFRINGQSQSVIADDSKIIIRNEFTGPNEFYGGGATYNLVELHGTTNFNAVSNRFDSLVLKAGSDINFSNNETQIVNQLVVEGNGEEVVTISSNSLGNQANILQNSGEVIFDFAQIQDVNVLGGATFTAINSTDLGNNSGISFQGGFYVQEYVPETGALEVSRTPTLSMKFNEDLSIGSRNLNLHNYITDEIVETIDVLTATVNANELTFTPAQLDSATTYYITADTGIVTSNVSSEVYNGINDKDVWKFTTVGTNDSLALVAFYFATNGPNWNSNFRWLDEGEPISDWSGITVEDGRVTSISLNSNNLTGSLPAELNNLDSLRILSIARNNISGPLPDLSNLKNLNELKIGKNNFTGNVPEYIGDFTQLTRLGMADNEFTGFIPSNFNQLINVNRWNISGNALDSLPDLTNLTQLFLFDVSYNKIDASDLVLNSSVITADLGQTIAVTASDSLALVELYNRTNGANWFNSTNWLETETFVAEWHGVKVENGRVVELLLNNNNLNGALPDALNNLDQLEILNVSSNNLFGDIPNLNNLVKLKEVSISNNNFSGTLPDYIGDFTRLSEFILSDNFFEGAIPSTFAQLRRLEIFNIRDNNFDSLPDLNSLNRAVNFDVSFNKIDREDILLNLSVISRNDGQRLPVLTQDSLALVALFNATNGEMWNNNSNWLQEGTLVSDWIGVETEFGRVVSLDLPNRNLSGTLPNELNNLDSLKILGLARNSISGPLPADLSRLTQLKELKLGQNNFSGTLPDYIGSFEELDRFGISENNFTGSVPTSYNQLTKLNRWNIKQNQIDSLPDLTNLRNLSLFDVSVNRIDDDDIFLNLSIITRNDGQFSVSGNITQNTTWSGLVVISGPVYVEPGVTLTIEPGTIVKGIDGDGDKATYIVIAKGATINAVGTPNDPIIFTSVLDNIQLGDFRGTNYGPTFSGGLWGGLIIMGDAPVSGLDKSTGLDATSLSFEGLVTASPYNIYGGANATDNSGILQYVSIRHTGRNVGSNLEMSSLTLAGVGSNTIIDNVEVVASQYDGIELIGGTVNATNVIVYNAEDDSFDTDQSYGGTVDNFVVLGRGDNIFELDGPEGALENGGALFTNGSINAGASDNLIDFDTDSDVSLSNLYFYNVNSQSVEDYSLYEANLNGYSIANFELATPTSGLTTSEIFTQGSDAFVTEVNLSENTVGADISGFGWSYAAFSNALGDLGFEYSIQEQDSLALVAIYNATNGASWFGSTGWLEEGVSVNDWLGITTEADRVIGISINSNNLTGSIPAEIANLSDLETLNLSNNNLTGILPDFGSLTKLNSVSLNDNQLEGFIPAGLGNSINMDLIDLHSNSFSGAIPNSFNQLRKLNRFNIRENNLVDLPDLNLLRNLAFFDVSYNKFEAEDIDPNELVITLNEGQLIPVSTADSLALVDFYNQTNGPDWINFFGETQWLTDTLVAAWSGVGVINNRVAILELANRNINGVLPPAINDLNGLRVLGLARNGLTGNLPDLSGFSDLEEFKVANNGFTGAIPNNLGDNLQLRQIGLAGNQFTGTLPSNFSNLQQLERMNIRDNRFDSLPDLSALNQLEYFDVSRNRIPDKDIELNSQVITRNEGQLVSVDESDSLALVAFYMALNGPSWTNSSNWLEEGSFIVEWNGIQVANRRIISITLGNNNLTGSIPSEIGNLTELQILGLERNNIFGDLPDLSSLTKLEEVRLGQNYITGIIPEALGNNLELRRLGLSNNSFQGALPESFQNLINLDRFNISNNRLDSLPDLSELFQLSFWDVSFNRLGVEDLFPNIDVITRNDGQTMPTDPTDSLALVALYNATDGANWKLGFNSWAQTEFWVQEWPGVITRSGRVVEINLSEFGLTGNLPPEIGNLTMLEILELGQNEITGELPVEMVNLTNLKVLNLSSNKFTGSIPNLSGALSLTRLELENNLLSGAIPAFIGELPQINTVTLANNKLSGDIPATFVFNNQIAPFVDLRDNDLTGSSDLTGFNGTLYITNNRFTFEDLELLQSINTSNFGQKPFGLLQTLFISEGESIELTTDYTAGSSDNLQWLLNGFPIEGETSETLSIPSLTSDDYGTYTLRVLSDVVTNFTLLSDDIVLTQGTEVSGNIVSNTTWTNEGIIGLRGQVFVEPGVTLTIEPGTVIKALPGEGTNAALLVISNGATIDAQGTQLEPIIFTSAYDEITSTQTEALNLGETDNEYWGGIVVLGNAPISDASNQESVDLPGTGNGFSSYGGNDPAHSSGILSHISIRHAGAIIEDSPSSLSLSGLTLAGVGLGTSIDNIEVYSTGGKGMSILGGTVELNNVIVWWAEDNAMVIDKGYDGSLSNFIISMSPKSSQALQIEGPEGSDNGTFDLNFGSVRGGLFSDNNGMADFRDGATGSLSNVFFFNFPNPLADIISEETANKRFDEFAVDVTIDYPGDLELDDPLTSENYFNGNLSITNNEFESSYAVQQLVQNNGGDEFAFDAQMAMDNRSDVFNQTVGANTNAFDIWSAASRRGLLFSFGSVVSDVEVSIDPLSTNNPSPELTGLINDPDAQVFISIGERSFQALNNGDGTWILSQGTIDPPLADGFYDVIVRGVNGIVENFDNTFNELFIDSTPPSIEMDVIGTSIRSPQLTGLIDDIAAPILLELDGNTYEATNNADGTWTLNAGSISPDLSDGAFNVRLISTDSLGNIANILVENAITITDQILALDASRITPSSFRANWSEPLDVISYQIDVATDDTFVSIIETAVDLVETNYEVQGLEFETDYFYRVRFVNSEGTSENSNTIQVSTTISTETAADFDALATIYNKLGGASWVGRDNWINGKKQTWEGVGLTGSRVTSLDLSNSELAGTFSFEEALTELTTINLSGNRLLNGLEQLTQYPNLNSLDVSGTSVLFNHLELQAGITNLVANDLSILMFDQATGGPLEVDVNTDGFLSISTPGAANNYQWFYNGNQIISNEFFEVTDAELIIQSIGLDNMGDFDAIVTNNIITGVELVVDMQTVLAVADISVEVIDGTGNPTVETLNAQLLDATSVGSFDTVSEISNQVGTFAFNNVVIGNFLLVIDPQTGDFIPTYYGNAFLWEEADTAVVRSDTLLTIFPEGEPEERDQNPETNPGTVGVSIFEDFGDETSGRIEARRKAARRKCGLRRRRTGGRSLQDQDDFELYAYGETNDEGEFEFGFLEQGTYRFFVEYPGIPLGEAAFVEFEVGEGGVGDTDFKLTADVTEDGIEVRVQNITSVIKDYFKDLNVYPNPASKLLNIEYSRLNAENVYMQLIDMSGNVHWSKKLERGQDRQVSIEVDQYAEGVYFLYMSNEDNQKVITYKVVISR